MKNVIFRALTLCCCCSLAHRVHVVLPGSTASMSINFVTALHTVSPWKLENEPIQTLKRNSTSLSRKCSQQSSPRLNRRARENRRRGKNVGKKSKRFTWLVKSEASRRVFIVTDYNFFMCILSSISVLRFSRTILFPLPLRLLLDATDRTRNVFSNV